MLDEIIYYEYIDDLCNIDFKDEKLLQLFSIYISSIRDFKYNATYLTDSIATFKKSVEIFQNKKEKVQKFSENLIKKCSTPCDWFMVFDDVFLIDNYFRFTTLITFIKNFNSSNDENTLYILEKIKKNHLKQFNLFSLNSKKIKVVYYNLVDKRNYSYIDEFSSKWRLPNLVESDYIKLSAKEE